MSLNHRRRLFRHGSHLSLQGLALPARRTVALGLGGVLAFGAAGWLLTRSSQAPAQPPQLVRLVTPARHVAVVDGATLRLLDQVVRLDGIDPPVRGDTCRGPGGAPLDCGSAAANALASLVNDFQVDCTLQGMDKAGRALAVCATRVSAINQAMVASGWARAEPSKQALVAVETEARAARRGLWAAP